MVKNSEWIIPKNIERPVETVYEIKGDEYKVPSFEEFMESYERDEKVENSYADELESYNEVGVDKGYGPCYSCGSYSATFNVVLKAEWGADHQYIFGIPLTETPKRSIDPFSNGAETFIDSVLTNYHNMSGIWQDGYMRIGIKLTSTSQAEELLRHFANGNLKVRGRGNVHHRGAENVLINTVRTALSDHRGGRDVNINRSF